MTTMIGYLRVSTEEQATSGLGLDAQRESIQRYANGHGWDVVWYVDEGLSAKNLDRPQLQAALARLQPKNRDADGLLFAKLDRLSRSVADFAGLLEQALRRKWSLVAIDLGVNTSTAVGELVANVMAAVAQWERRIIGERTSAAMQVAKRNGKHVGRIPVLSDATAERVLELNRSGLSAGRIASRLNDEGTPAALGGQWYASTVAKTLARILKVQEAAA